MKLLRGSAWRPAVGALLATLAMMLAAAWGQPPLADGGGRGALEGDPAAAPNAAPIPARPPAPNVVALEIVGNKHIDRNKIVARLKTRAGRPLEPDLLERDLRELNRSGWFVEVRPKTRPVEGGVIVTFEVVERPRLQYVKYFGNERIRSSRLEKETKLKAGDPLSPYEVDEARQKIEQFYQDRGFNQVQVSVLEGNKPTDKGAAFLIHEGTPQKISWTSFEGNTIVTDARLRTLIQSKPGVLWMFKGQLEPKKIDEDVDRVTSYYRGLGYFRARVSREYKTDPQENWVHVTFYIHEGPRYEVRNVVFQGNRVLSTPQLREDLKITGGQFFDRAQAEKDLAKIRDQYGSQGYVFADVKTDLRFDEEGNQLDLVYNIAEGDRYRIGKINVIINGLDGATGHTRHNVVRNHLSVYPGDIADIREIRKSQVRLQRSGLFEYDPSRGIAPKLAFSRPEDAEGSSKNVARGSSSPRVRSQSPDDGLPPARDLDVYEIWRDGVLERVAVPREAARFAPRVREPSSGVQG